MKYKSAYIRYDQLLRLGREINTWLRGLDGSKINLHRGANRQTILRDIKGTFDRLVDSYPNDDLPNFPGIPSGAFEFYQSIHEIEDDGHFSKIPHNFLQNHLKNLSGNAAKILWAFTQYMSFESGNEGETFVSLETISKDAGVSINNIHVFIKELKAMGHIVSLRRVGNKVYRKICLVPLRKSNEGKNE